MKHQPVMSQDATEAILTKSRKLFEAGEIHETWDQLSALVDRTDLSKDHKARVQYLQLGCAVYKVGDLDAANRLNTESLIVPSHLPLRYRLAIRQKQPRLAKRLRTCPEVQAGDARLIEDFKCSAAIYCLWNGRMNAGIRLAPSRAKAILFPDIIPNELDYVPLSDDPTKDHPIVILEPDLKLIE